MPTLPSRTAIALVFVVVLLVAAACSIETTIAGPSDPGATPADPSATPTAPPAPGESLWPDSRPTDFGAGYSGTGGMAPWAESVDLLGSVGTYEVWMNDVTYQFVFTPLSPRLDSLYEEIRLGRFEEYEVVPFEDGEKIFDASTDAYWAQTATISHRLIRSGQDLRSPDTGRSPLSMLRHFVDVESVPDAQNALTIVFDDEISRQIGGGLDVLFDLGDADFAMGTERWANEFTIFWSGESRDVPVTISLEVGEEVTVISEQVVRLEPGGRIELSLTVDGSITATAT